MTNKKRFKLAIEELGCTQGCYDKDLEKLPYTEVVKVMDELDQEYTDVKVHIGKDLYIVEIATVDGQKDLNLLSALEYSTRYGRNVTDEED